MAFTEVEMAILSRASYMNLPDGAEEKSLYAFLNENKKSLLDDLGKGYEDAYADMLANLKKNDCTIIQSENDKHGTGFAAFAVVDGDNNVTVACRGTEGFSLDYDSKKDVIADLELTASLQTCQQRRMEAFVRRLEENEEYKSYSFTGHSLGGNLAMYGAICLRDPDKMLSCQTFNAPGFNAAFLEANKFRISRIEDRMIAFQNERDSVSECFKVPGKRIVLECDGFDAFFGIGALAHGLEYLIPNKDGTGFIRNHTGMKDVTILGYLLDRGTDSTDFVVEYFKPLILAMDFDRWRKNEGKIICRDFSEEAKQMMLDAAKETEEEKWWQISRWDCWYKLDRYFGGAAADWDRYTGNVDAYYRKLIDMNDSTAKDIEKIFQTVYTVDRTTAEGMRARTQALQRSIRARLEKIRDAILPKITIHENYSIPKQAYKPVIPQKTNAQGERSAEAYNEVMDAFQVATNPRYQPRNGDTWCNIYVWDVTTAMGCEIPHYYNKKTGEPMTRDQCLKNPGTYYEMSANRMTKWLEKYGAQYGWVECDEATAISQANQGMPTVTVGTDTGHVAMVAPQADGETGVMISQAGGRNFNHGKLSSGFGKHPVKYFYHP